VGIWNETAAWITGYSQVLNDWLHQKNFRGAKVASYPAAFVLSIKDRWNRMLLEWRAHRGGQVEICESFDERFDEFWEELLCRYSQKLLAVRTRATLQWHFHYALQEKRIWVITVSKDARLQAYAIFVLPRAKPGDRIRRMRLADFQSLDRNDCFYYATLRSALRQSRRSGIHLLSTMGVSASGTDTSVLAPYRKAQPNWTFIYKTQDPMLARVLADPRAWCPSLYDGDATL
jgi:hypothetical protein